MTITLGDGTYRQRNFGTGYSTFGVGAGPGDSGQVADPDYVLGVWWHGTDGSVWPLHDHGGGVVMEPETSIFGPPTEQISTLEYVSRHGGEISNFLFPARQDASFKIAFFSVDGETPRQYMQKYQRFTKSMSPAGEGRLVVETLGGRRSLSLIPTLREHQSYQRPDLHRDFSRDFYFYAPNPFWVGDAVDFHLGRAAAVGLFKPTVGRHETWFVSSSFQNGKYWVDNPSDWDTGFVLFIGGGAGQVTFEVGTKRAVINVPNVNPGGAVLDLSLDPPWGNGLFEMPVRNDIPIPEPWSAWFSDQVDHVPIPHRLVQISAGLTIPPGRQLVGYSESGTSGDARLIFNPVNFEAWS